MEHRIKESGTAPAKQESKKSPLQQIKQFISTGEQLITGQLTAEQLRRPHCTVNNELKLKFKSSVNFQIYPLLLIEEFYQNKIRFSGKKEWSARFVITTNGELRLEQEGTSINSSSIARHAEMPANGPDDITITSELAEDKPAVFHQILAAGKLYFELGKEKPVITRIDANSGCYKPEFGSTAWVIATLLFCEERLLQDGRRTSPLLAETILLDDLYGTKIKQSVRKEDLQILLNTSKTMQAAKADFIEKNVGAKAKNKPILIKKEAENKNRAPGKGVKLVLDNASSNVRQISSRLSTFQASLSDLNETMNSTQEASKVRRESYEAFFSAPLEESRTSSETSSDSEMEGKSRGSSYASSLALLGTTSPKKRKAEKENRSSTPDKKNCDSSARNPVFSSPLKSPSSDIRRLSLSTLESESFTPPDPRLFGGLYSAGLTGISTGDSSEEIEESVFLPDMAGFS